MEANSKNQQFSNWTRKTRLTQAEPNAVSVSEFGPNHEVFVSTLRKTQRFVWPRVNRGTSSWSPRDGEIWVREDPEKTVLMTAAAWLSFLTDSVNVQETQSLPAMCILLLSQK